MITRIGQYGQSGLVPLGTLEMSVNGIQRVLHHSISEYPYQMDFKRGFLEVLREEHFELAKQNSKFKMQVMENSQYFSTDALVEVYPVLGYLAPHDNDLAVGKRYATIGSVEVPLHVVKVGEAVTKDDTNWKTGIYRVSSVLLSEKEEG